MLESISKSQRGKDQKKIQGLPKLPDLRMALGVAAADLRPLVVLYAPDSKQRTAQTKQLEELAWSEAFVGRLRYVVIEDRTGLEGFEAMELKTGISVVQAEAYGRGGKVLSHVNSPKDTKSLGEILQSGLTQFDAKAKNVRSHLAKGERENIKWVSAIPVSDPQAKR